MQTRTQNVGGDNCIGQERVRGLFHILIHKNITTYSYSYIIHTVPGKCKWTLDP